MRRALAVLPLLVLTACSDPQATGSEPPANTWTSTAVPSATTEAEDPTDINAIAVLGHSGATGRGTVDKAGSWATGRSVQSIARKLAEKHPEVEAHAYNVAVDGSLSGDLSAQAEELIATATLAPDLIFIQTGGNDIRCVGPSRMFEVTENVSAAMRRLGEQWPDAEFMVVTSVASEHEYAEMVAADPNAPTSLGTCGDLNADHSVNTRKVKLGQQKRFELDNALYEACGSQSRCVTDRGALTQLRFTLKDYDVAHGDYEHRSESGQQKIADAIWKVLSPRFRR